MRLGQMMLTGTRSLLATRNTSIGLRAMSDFAGAQERLKSLSEAPDNETKLKLYALFKQASEGQVTSKRPGMMDMVGRFKWDAWNTLGSMSKEEAGQKYTELVDSLIAAEGGGSESNATEATAAADGHILHQRVGNVFHIILNRPDKYNAITTDMYRAIEAALRESAEDESTKFTVISAKGKYYSAGNDLGNFMVDMSDIPRVAADANVLMQSFVNSMIDHPKPLIGLVQGPAVGITVTTLALFDVVYASDAATFHAPFSHLGQSPEGCSSFLFPRIMGPAKANEFLLFGRKLTAKDALDSGLITRIFPNETFAQETSALLEAYAKLPPQSMRLSKNLIRGHNRQLLRDVNKAEGDLLEERWQSKECANAIANFFSRNK